MSTSLTATNSPNVRSFHVKPSSKNPTLSPYRLSYPPQKTQSRAVKTGFNGSGQGRLGSEAFGSEVPRRPVEPAKEEDDASDASNGGDGDTWVDWEDCILEDTVPLVGFVRMILHSGKYESGDKLSPEHEGTILERLLPFHPQAEKKIGCGIDYVTIGYHPKFESSRCLFIVRKDGETVDFSYWKCIKGFIRKNYPLYADTFILRHFRKRRRGGDD